MVPLWAFLVLLVLLAGVVVLAFVLISSARFQTQKEAISGLVGPLRESLAKVDNKIALLEQNRVGAYQGISEQIKALAESSRALHAPGARGRWGEMQLRRVVELAGMVAHCDFEEQTYINTEGDIARPDMIVKLPGQKCIVVDAKVPLNGYMLSLEAQTEDQRLLHLKEHAVQVRRHVMQLSKKQYWQHFDKSPEIVVLFLPGESFFSAALTADPTLIEMGVENKVIIATPTTLIALLKSVALGWRQEALQENAQQISRLAHELTERLIKMTEHFQKLGKNLRMSVEAYNQTLGSFESRVLPTARKMAELSNSETKLELTMDQVDVTPRLITVRDSRDANVENEN